MAVGPCGWLRRLVACALLLALRLPGAAAAEAPELSQLETYAQPDGAGYFVLSLGLDPKQAPAKPVAHDVVLLVDTSASQTGDYRQKVAAIVDELLKAMNPGHSVALVAVDVTAVAFFKQLVEPQSQEAQVAAALLGKRTPLGATDLAAGLEAALAIFTASAKNRPRDIVYLGDGISTARLLPAPRLQAIVDKLVAARVAVHTHCIGPRLDLQLLGALSNHTGGLVQVDNDDTNARQAALFLSDALDTDVFWPQTHTLPEAFIEVLPRRLPPFRFDRESVLLGKFKPDAATSAAGTLVVKIQGQLRGKKTTFEWEVKPVEASDDNAYLAEVVNVAQTNGGINLPTAGAGGLAGMRWLVTSHAQDLARLAQQALVTGSFDQADQLAGEALRLDPKNPEAIAVRAAAGKARTAGGGKPKTRVLKLDDATGAPDSTDESPPAQKPASKPRKPPKTQ